MDGRNAATGEGLRALAQFTAEARLERFPAEIVEKARACLLYAIAVGVAGMRVPQPAQAVRAVAKGSTGKATRLYDDRKCDAGHAAFANGTLFHARVQDDAHPAGHVGVVVIPTALAMAETTRASGADLLAAIIAGYETALRIGRDHATDLSTRGFRTTPAYGVFGAAAAASRLLGMDAAATAHALSLAANMAGGLREYSEAGSEDYPYQAGIAASNGIMAARLADAGATAAASALDGKAGFFRAYGHEDKRYELRLADDLGTVFEMSAITYKPYPICQFHRGVVRGSAILSGRANGRALASLTVRMHPFEADFYGVRYAGPFATFPQTFMSAPFCAALGWTRGTADLRGLTNFLATDVLALVKRVTIVSDDGRARYAPLLEAKLADGTMLEWEERERAGAYALTWHTAVDMADQLLSEIGAPQKKARRLVDSVAEIDGAAGVGQVISALHCACLSART